MATRRNYITNNFNAPENKLGKRTITSNMIDGKRYYSSLDAEIFFGETHIDTLVQISWAMEQAAMPLFGYNSYTFDDIAIGARQVSGNFIVNFTKSGFMYDVLKTVQAVNRSSMGDNEEGKLEWDSHYEKEHSAAWDKSFNIRVNYGDSNSTMVVLYCVQLISCQQAIGIDGSPIGEIYGFIAKDIRYETIGLTERAANDLQNKAKTVPMVKATPFNFNIKNIELIKSELNSGYYNLNNGYRVRINYDYSGGDVQELKLTLKKIDREIINSAAFDIGVSKSSEYSISNSYKAIIDRAINSQRSLNVSNQDVYLLYDLKVVYSQNGKVKAPLSLNNRKLYLSAT